MKRILIILSILVSATAMRAADGDLFPYPVPPADMTTLQEFSAWLEAEGLQAIATRVSTGSECQIIIEDGMVKDAVPPEEKPQPRSWTKGAF